MKYEIKPYSPQYLDDHTRNRRVKMKRRKCQEVVGRTIGFQQEQSGEKTTDLVLYAKDLNPELLSQLLTAGIRESQKLGMEILHIGLREPSEDIRKFYESYGLKFRTAAAYYTK